MTDQLMKALTTRDNGAEPSATPRFGRYDYTDLSPFFFSLAKDKYRDQGARVQFNTLDIEKDPETQGFENGSYDVVVASGVSIIYLILDAISFKRVLICDRFLRFSTPRPNCSLH